LGHQVIAEALGGRVVRAPKPVHGQASEIRHEGRGLFEGLPQTLRVGRYHSLVAQPESLSEPLRATAWTSDGVVMALEHRELPVFGVQFHPESILTDHGYELLANFLRLAGLSSRHEATKLTAHERPKAAAAERAFPKEPVTF
jgi:anthranilate synthase/aminodeoxychorismate synthase-like glutamine amidotransferase